MHIAARMESTSMPMHIQATKLTVRLLNETKWQCVERGMVEVKVSVLQLHSMKMHFRVEARFEPTGYRDEQCTTTHGFDRSNSFDETNL